MTDTNQTQTDKKEMSKKSEKLEIRLSYEEKQELASVAETEGRTVSDLVRGLIRRYVRTSAARLPQKRSWLKWAGIGLVGLLIGHLATYAYTRSHHKADIYSLSLDTRNGHLVTPILAKDGYSTKITMADQEGDVVVSLAVNKKTHELTVLEADICRVTPEGCKTISTPILHFNPNSAAVININNGHKNEINMHLMRTRH